MIIKRQIVVGLEHLCGIIDNLPTIGRRYSGYGCWPLKLAELSDKLDQKWKTGVWK